ncbi:DgyrCDS7483 [Dimorphilus gyrociliatus]|uniref:DgyrCDS7483 n=1 Tax=Dimorphilus gyrociliatus TaxID=2664684 RepID=A0A7I8VSU8_9ANNE|nr:DgyrCDS7483 [Dimorphilus gyrociliatus]
MSDKSKSDIWKKTKIADSSLSANLSSMSGFRGSGRRKTNFLVLQQEYLKEQQLAQLLKEKRIADLRPIHYLILNDVSQVFNSDLKFTLDCVMDTSEQFQLFESFVGEFGRNSLMFFRQFVKNQQRIFIADGTREEFSGQCIIFLKNNPQIQLEEENFYDIVNMCQMDNSLPSNTVLMSAVEPLRLANTNGDENEPCRVSAYKPEIKSVNPLDFLGQIDNFISTLTDMENSFNESVKLEISHEDEIIDGFDITKLDYQTSVKCSNNTAVIKRMEVILMKWLKVIEQTLMTTRQMRREADDSGPLSELEHWRHLTVKFHILIDTLNKQPVSGLTLCMSIIKHPLLRTWKEVENKVINMANEARDNLKFLYTLESCCKPLYEDTPIEIINHIPSIINTIRMIKAVSMYYNTSERVTSLFVKITNQMIKACRKYLTNGQPGQRIWDFPTDLELKRIKDCHNLYQSYQDIFHEVQESIVLTPGEKNLEISETYIFGKFDSFCKRLDKVGGLLNYVRTYSTLKYSKIEGIESIWKKFESIFIKMKNQDYDPLDYKNLSFDNDCNEFDHFAYDLEAQLQNFMNSKFQSIDCMFHSCTLLKRFEALNLPRLPIKATYKHLFLSFGHAIEGFINYYNKFRNKPECPFLSSSFGGRILWSRNLLKRLETTMKFFESEKSVFYGNDSQRCVACYNRLITALCQYEKLQHEAWIKSVEDIKNNLQSPLLYKITDKDQLVLNFDWHIKETIKEGELMKKLHMDIPDDVVQLIYEKKEIDGYYHSLNLFINDLENVKANIPNILKSIVKPLFKKLDMIIQPGLTTLTWSSISIQLFADRCQLHLNHLKEVLNQIYDTKKYRIDDILHKISKTKLLIFPEDLDYVIDDTNYNTVIKWSLDEFKTRIKRVCQHQAKNIDNWLAIAEQGVKELIEIVTLKSFDNYESSIQLFKKKSQEDSTSLVNIFVSATSLEDVEGVEKLDIQQRNWDKCQELFDIYGYQAREAFLTCLRENLETLKNRLLPIKEMSSSKNRNFSVAKLHLFLNLPNVRLKPTLEDFQSTINSIVYSITRTLPSTIIQWGEIRQLVVYAEKELIQHEDLFYRFIKSQQGYSSNLPTSLQQKVILPAEVNETKSMLKTVLESKDLSKLSSQLKTIASLYKEELDDKIRHLSSDNFLWIENLDDRTEGFLGTSKGLYEFLDELKAYDDVEMSIDILPNHLRIGALDVDTTPLIESLKVENNRWRTKFLQKFNKIYKIKADLIKNFLEDHIKRLQRPIKDLEDVRNAMSTLESVKGQQLKIDADLTPIEECYSILHKYELTLTKDEADMIDSLRFKLNKLNRVSSDVTDNLLKLQPKFRKELESSINQFITHLNKFAMDYEANGPMEESISAEEASERLILFQIRFDNLFRSYETYHAGEKLFGLPEREYPYLKRIKKELNLLQKLYSLYKTTMDSINGFSEIPWSDVKIDRINDQLIDLQNKCRRLPRGLKEWPAYYDLKKKIDEFNECCPLLEMMASKSMKNRHWEKLSILTGTIMKIENEDFRLKDIMRAPLLIHREDIEDICVSSHKEKEIEAKLCQIESEWNEKYLQLTTFKNRGEILLKGQEISDVITLMDDSLMLLGSLLANRYNTFFKKKIQDWTGKLTNSREILENWMTVQNLWIYLEAVFVGGDIAKQLPREAKRFHQIDRSWVKIMTRAREDPNIINACVGDEALGQLLPHLLEQLEICQKSLTGYLETKRTLFPRFYFVSDPTLLEILGQASDPHTIELHLLDIFENTAKISWSPQEYDKIMCVFSSEGDKLNLNRPIKAAGNVEKWLNDLLEMNCQSLHRLIQKCYYSISEDDFCLVEFLNKSIAQIGILGLQITWTRESEYALQNSKYDKKIMNRTSIKFNEILNMLIQKTTEELSEYERTKYETLITIHVHQKDIMDDLIKKNTKTVRDFNWQKQTRFYYKEDDDECLVQITNVTFRYQNEFLGCRERLVITPLTDRCYITLAQALDLSLGGAPTGPAGTGKTETVKDMAKTLGKYCIVFNCSDQMDYRGLGRIFKGLAQSGSWGCFDEFNRIELPVLSVAAQQISLVHHAKKEHKKHFIFSDGTTVPMNDVFGIFITMNPGYAGRQELPENLKLQFRCVAMMIPDQKIIMRVKLASSGFLDNVLLAEKFNVLYKLCEEQLSKQVHYDFGLRNILSVLRTIGSVKRNFADENESKLVMRVLRDMNLSKLVDEDEPIFLSLIRDLFPDISIDVDVYQELQKAITDNIDRFGLVNSNCWNLKIIQLYEIQKVRHGLMVLGPTGSGKTTCIRTLMKSLTDCGELHREMRMNPKAITSSQMFGKLDVATNDWTDGIFSTLWRRTKKKKGEHSWIVLDGPVDALWIENLNSVLDDNKTLTLANGDRIPMSSTSRLVFEVHSIDNASPATVSRMGMVFISSFTLSWESIIQSRLRDRPPGQADKLFKLYQTIFVDIDEYFSINLNPLTPTLQCMRITQSFDLTKGFLQEFPDVNDYKLEKLFVMSLLWSFGALLEKDDRTKLVQYLRNHPSGFCIPCGDPFEWMVSKSGNWEHWETRVPEYHFPTDYMPNFSSILVPNVDNTRMAYIIDTICKQGKAVLLIGEQGTAKTVMVKKHLKTYNPDKHLTKIYNFSSETKPITFQKTIESYLDKRVGSTYGPPNGRKMTIFIDDINMPEINEWGDQVTNEITRQLIETNGFYSLNKPGDFNTLVDLQFIGAMIHPGGGRNDIPQRLKRHFSIFNCTLPADKSIDRIFSTIGLGYFSEKRSFPQRIIDLIPKLVEATRLIWQNTKSKMLPTPTNFHYVFNLRDLSRVWEGMLKANSNEITEEYMLLSLWKCEVSRVLSDRFVSESHMKWFNTCLTKVATNLLGDRLLEQIPNEPYFVNFMRDPPECEDDFDEFEAQFSRPYELVNSWQELTERIKMFMSNMNEQIRGANMNLVLFRDAVIHIIKITRIFGFENGNMLLVGVGGSGKQSLTRLASFIQGLKTFRITLTRAYNITNFIEDLKTLHKLSGKDGKGVAFIFTDNDIKEESFLELLNNLLSSGEVSNLFQKDELEEITQDLIPVMKREFPKKLITFENLYDFFISRCRKNLHVILCFSPVGEKFRSRSLKFPGLISGCTLNWFQEWPKDALIAVGSQILSDLEVLGDDKLKDGLVDVIGTIHDRVSSSCYEYFKRFRRRTFTTPKTYLTFVNMYKQYYTKKMSDVNDTQKRILTGLEKLAEASQSVDMLNKELAEKEIYLRKATEMADDVLTRVTINKKEAEIAKTEVMKLKIKAASIVDEISIEKAAAESKLEAAKPALEEAENALKTIKAQDIQVVKKLGKPPHLIMRIMDCVLILLRRKLDKVTFDQERSCIKPSWNESLKAMSQSSFLNDLKNFPKDTINGEMVELLLPYLEADDYNIEVARRMCGDVAGLCSWTRAMRNFYEVNKEVIPLKLNLAVQEGRFITAKREEDAAQVLLDSKENELAEVQKMYNEAEMEKRRLMDDAKMCQEKIDMSNELINALSGEKLRWTEQSRHFNAQKRNIIGDCVICIAFINYCGPFNQEYRNILLTSWREQLQKAKIPFTIDIDLISTLADLATIGEWNLQGLPNDELSLQGLDRRYPLLIDPQMQGKLWLKNKGAINGLQITHLSHRYFRNHLEDCLSMGRPLLIEDVGEELDPILDNILDNNIIRIGRNFKICLGDKEVDFDPNFRLYITTKLPNPVFSPEISASTTTIDFTVTMTGLEDQLLGRVIQQERAELEKEKIALVQEISNNNRRIKELESDLLEKLTDSTGCLIENRELIEVLNVTKKMAGEIEQKLKVAAETTIKINSARNEYKLVATRGSILYFLICDMSMLNPMYQTSLRQFLKIFDNSLMKSERSLVQGKRIRSIINTLTQQVYHFVVTGLYEKHRFLFTLLITLKIDLGRNYVKRNEFEILIKGGANLDIKSTEPKIAKWISDHAWLNLVSLSSLNTFNDIIKHIKLNEKAWKLWFEKDEPEEEEIPKSYGKALDSFRRLLLIRSWCPDRTISQARKYVADSLGDIYTQPVLLDLERIYQDSDPKSPMLCLLSMGSDPTALIEILAKSKQTEVRTISMGQGQEIYAIKFLKQFMIDGGWILLQNCHLSLSFMIELVDRLLENEHIHPSFRLWMTSEVHEKFPITLLQISTRFTNEPPEGIRAGLKRTYGSITQEVLDMSNMMQWKPLLYAISFLHSVIQERRTFGYLGWNIPYDFNQSDWNACIQFIQNHLDDAYKIGISWTTIRYMISEVHYGGRVTDDYDKNLLKTLIKVWFSDDIFHDDFTFSQGYSLPFCTTSAEYLTFIDSLPKVDHPTAFGLHSNADITKQSNFAKDVLDGILSIQPKESVGGEDVGETRETVVYRLAEDILTKLPIDYDFQDIKQKLNRMGNIQPLNIFLKQEIDRLYKVISTMRITLTNLKLAIEGTIIMSDQLKDAFNSIYDAKIPLQWIRISWESSTLGFWFSELLDRHEHLTSWLKSGRPNSFWLAGFFNPQGFLTAMRQEVTRSHKGWSLDSVVLSNDVTKLLKEDVIQGPLEGVYIYGLYLEGAGWDRKNSRLTEAVNKILFSPLPIIHVYAIQKDKFHCSTAYSCPVYKRSIRNSENYVANMNLRTTQSCDHWIMRGVAILCDIK